MANKIRCLFNKRLLHFQCGSRIQVKVVSSTSWQNLQPFVTTLNYSTHSQNNSNKNNNGTFWPWLSVGGILAAFFAYKLDDKNTVLAAVLDQRSPFEGSSPPTPGGSSKRKTYNFVADVVDRVGNAVVYIERLGKYDNCVRLYVA